MLHDERFCNKEMDQLSWTIFYGLAVIMFTFEWCKVKCDNEVDVGVGGLIAKMVGLISGEEQLRFSDQMHCVCFVFDANKLTHTPKKEFNSVKDFLKTIGISYSKFCFSIV